MEKAFFYMHFSESERLLTAPIAYSSHEWISESQKRDPDFHFAIDSEGLNDYLMNNSNLPLMSERMKALFSGVRGAEKATWHPVDVVDRKGRIWPYYIPCFKEAAPVLNREESEMVDGVLVNSVFDAKKLADLDFFPVEPGAEIRLLVSGTMRETLEKARMTGLEFAPAKVV